MWSAILGCLWIVLVSCVALVPFPRHQPYAIALLGIFPVLLVMLTVELGWPWALVFFLSALSIYRYPAMYYARRLRQRIMARLRPDPDAPPRRAP